jgi:hypothetical protein
VHSLCRTYHRLEKHFAHTQVTWVMWNLLSIHLEMVLVSVQDRCTVWTEHTTGLEIILDAPDGTPR